MLLPLSIREAKVSPPPKPSLSPLFCYLLIAAEQRDFSECLREIPEHSSPEKQHLFPNLSPTTKNMKNMTTKRIQPHIWLMICKCCFCLLFCKSFLQITLERPLPQWIRHRKWHPPLSLQCTLINSTTRWLPSKIQIAPKLSNVFTSKALLKCSRGTAQWYSVCLICTRT